MVLLSLGELISLNPQGFSLDATNTAAGLDSRNNGNLAHFRTTGMKLTVQIEYSNLLSDGTAALSNSNVDATLAVNAEGGWAGAGPQVFFPQAPTFDADGAKSYEKMTRYRQGIEVVFQPSGMVYAFEWQKFMDMLLNAYLYLAIAVTIMDFITFTCLPNGRAAGRKRRPRKRRRQRRRKRGVRCRG